jgi:DNA-binding MarR family transcriptional regulator
MTDHVDLVLTQWAAVRPDLDVSPMAVIGRLARVTRLIDAELRRTFASHGLDAASFDVLATLRRNDRALTAGELMNSAMVTSGAITQRLDRLESEGLVVRRPSSHDGRVVVVELTDAGLARVDETLPDHLATEKRLLAALGPQQRNDLQHALRELLRALDPAEGRPAPRLQPAVGVQSLEEQVHDGEVEHHGTEADDRKPRRA